MKFEHTQTFGWEGAFRGMRNPKDSWDKSDSDFSDTCYNLGYRGNCEDCMYFAGFGNPCAPKIGEKDMNLAQRLIRGGSEHRKFMRQIFVSVDITAPIYWWKEFDTYKIGTVANSTSTMHTIQKHEINKFENFEVSDFRPDLDMIDDVKLGMRVDSFLDDLEQLRQKFLMTMDKTYWKELIRWLPCGWLQKRTVTMSYENLLAMCSKGQRRFHKLTEWSVDFINWARTLPYAQELIFIDELDRTEEKPEPVTDGWLNVKEAAEAKDISASDLLALIECFENTDWMSIHEQGVGTV